MGTVGVRKQEGLEWMVRVSVAGPGIWLAWEVDHKMGYQTMECVSRCPPSQRDHTPSLILDSWSHWQLGLTLGPQS